MTLVATGGAMGFAAAAAPAAAPMTTAPPSSSPATSAQAPSATAGAPPRTPGGYLSAGTDLMVVLPPAPQKGDATSEADRRIFRETRALQGTPRWEMASADAALGSAQMLQHFSCSLDIELTAQQAPRMLQILQKATRDATQAMLKAKDFYNRERPYLVDEGPICRPREETGTSSDYPSGHSTAGWSWAMVLAQIAPDRAVPILERGRAIGDSRVVCGVHNASAVEGARMLVSATMAVVMGIDAYQSDLAAAKQEFSALRAQPHATPEPARCEVERKLVAIQPR
ncbi:MAG TPA: phosphatase PAP2 family protein [Steroidobacteraceae bacterium]|nr:phosphatase PAP2 family protein [Steroidobacteraceae bacterium]